MELMDELNIRYSETEKDISCLRRIFGNFNKCHYLIATVSYRFSHLLCGILRNYAIGDR